jgi:hypothetical protein
MVDKALEMMGYYDCYYSMMMMRCSKGFPWLYNKIKRKKKKKKKKKKRERKKIKKKDRKLHDGMT